jgi:N-formylmaleamate deformylase
MVRALEADYDCIMVDARGHGWSSAPESGYTNADHAADYGALIQTLGLAQPAIIGHSMGGGTSMQLAASYPGLLRGAVLEDPPWRPQDTISNAEDRRAFAEQWRNEVIANRTRSLEQLITAARQRSPLWSDAELDQWAPAKQQVSPQALDYAFHPSTPWWEVVGEITCPTLLVIADPTAGAIVDAATATQAVARNAKIEVAYIAGAGHNIRREQFDAYVTAVRAFLARLY